MVPQGLGSATSAAVGHAIGAGRRHLGGRGGGAGFRVWGLGFGVWGLGVGGWGLGVGGWG